MVEAKTIAETIIEKDSLTFPLLFIAAVFLFLLGGGVGLAYLGGVFTGKDEVRANDKRIQNQGLPHQANPLAPVSVAARDPSSPSQQSRKDCPNSAQGWRVTANPGAVRQIEQRSASAVPSVL